MTRAGRRPAALIVGVALVVGGAGLWTFDFIHRSAAHAAAQSSAGRRDVEFALRAQDITLTLWGGGAIGAGLLCMLGAILIRPTQAPK